MKTSDAGIKFISDQEAFVDHVYFDQAGAATIGFGHVLKMGDSIHLTLDEALALLKVDVGSAEAAVSRLVTTPILQCQFDALVSFTFNVGAGALSTSALLYRMNVRDFRRAADEFLKWDHITLRGQLVESAGLKRRRVLEQEMFLSGLIAVPEPSAPEAPITINDAPPVLPDEGQPTAPEDLPPVEDWKPLGPKT
jgi:lysozyme